MGAPGCPITRMGSLELVRDGTAECGARVANDLSLRRAERGAHEHQYAEPPPLPLARAPSGRVTVRPCSMCLVEHASARLCRAAPHAPMCLLCLTTSGHSCRVTMYRARWPWHARMACPRVSATARGRSSHARDLRTARCQLRPRTSRVRLHLPTPTLGIPAMVSTETLTGILYARARAGNIVTC